MGALCRHTECGPGPPYHLSCSSTDARPTEEDRAGGDGQCRQANQRVRPGGLYLMDPLGYRDFLALMANATLVLTDSGEIQEETTVLGVPCLTLRETTERAVTVERGTNVVVGTDPGKTPLLGAGSFICIPRAELYPNEDSGPHRSPRRCAFLHTCYPGVDGDPERTGVIGLPP